MTAETTVNEIERTFAVYANGPMREHVRRELERYTDESREQLIGVLVSEYEGGRYGRPPEAATIIRLAREAGIRRRPRRGETKPTDPEELEDWYFGPGGALEAVAKRVAARDEPDNITVVRLRAEADGEREPDRRPAPAEPPGPPSRSKEALLKRLRTMYDRHPDPASRDRRLRAFGVIKQLANAKRLPQGPEPPRPADMSLQAWESLSPAGRQAEHAFRAAEAPK